MWALAWTAIKGATATWPWKLIGIGVGVLTLMALAYFGYSHIAQSYADARAEGYKAGAASVTAEWNESKAEVARLNAEKADGWRAAGNDAVKAYIADHTARAPAVAAVTKDRIVYVHDKANAVPCVDAAGVDLLRRNRAADGISAGPTAATATR